MMDIKSLGEYLLHFFQDVVNADCFVDDSMGASDSLNMLGDSLVYGFSLYVLWRNAAWKAKAAPFASLLPSCGY